MKSILVVANDFPYPPDHGAALDMWSRILALLELGYDVDVVASVRRMPKDDHLQVVRKHVKNLWIVPRRDGLAPNLSLQPFQARSRIDLRNVDLGQRYGAIILEAEHVAPFLKNPAARNTKRILRIHNNESQYFRELAKGAGSWWKKLFYYLESCKFRFYSAAVRQECDLLWFISDFERTEHLRSSPEDDLKSFFLPPDVKPSALRSFATNSGAALFIGTLTIPHNADGVAWYVKEVHPLLSDVGNYRLMVAGRTADQSISSLKHLLLHYSNISLSENPDTLDYFYEKAAVFVNPVLRGAGVKLKIIQALQTGIPVVSTSIGVEGTGLQDSTHLLVADTPREFADCVRRLMTDSVLAEYLVRNAQTFLTENYQMRKNLQKILPKFFHENDDPLPADLGRGDGVHH